MSVNQSSGQSTPANVEMNQVWDMGRLVDLTVDFHNGMPVDVSAPLPSFELRELEEEMAKLCEGLEYRSYSQEIHLCVQAGNHLETGAHLYREMESVADVGLDRLFVSAVLLHVPKAKDEKVSRRDLEAALLASGQEIRPGEAILVATGYNRHTSGDQKAEWTPHFSYDAIEWAVGQAPAILASDMANWYDGVEEPNFWPMLLKSGTLVAGSLVNLSGITETRFRLIALPMKIRGAMAAPVRMIAVLPTAKE